SNRDCRRRRGAPARDRPARRPRRARGCRRPRSSPHEVACAVLCSSRLESMEKTPLAVRLGEFAARLRYEELPAAVVDKAKAFVNGVAVAVNNQCDSYHMLTHPGVLIVPAGLATAEGEGKSGRDLLTALVAGYEVQCRCARDFIPSTPAHGFRASPVYGILGCAATTARLLGLDARGPGNAIALAASVAGRLIDGQRTGGRDADLAQPQAARSGTRA